MAPSVVLFFNRRYRAHVYHPPLCYDGQTDNLLKEELCDGIMYCNKKVKLFMTSPPNEFIGDFPDMSLYLCGDSGFTSLDLYEALEDKNCRYAIQLKENA